MDKQTKLFQDAVILNDLGMHARPAAKIAEMAMEASEDIWLMKGEIKVDAGSIIDILSMCAAKGSVIRILADSERDADVVGNIKAYFEDGFGELTHE